MTIQQPISPALTVFGAAIKAERKARDWSLTTLADKALGNPDRKGYCSQVEKGLRNLSEGTIRSFARALDLPRSVTDPLTGHYLPQDDDTTQEDANASAMLKEAEALREKLKLSEALAVALAYKYADGNPTDIEGALKGLEDALELAAQEQARGQLPSNFDDAADAVVQRINALNDDGQIDAAYADLKAEAARRQAALEAQVAENGRILDLLITQAALANDAVGYAQAQYERVQLDAPGAKDSFDRLRALWRERYEDGLRRGTPFSLMAAIGLARKCIDIEPTPYLKAMAQNDLAIALQQQGTRTAGPEGATLLAEAVDTYRAALRVRTEADHPVDWAMTMQNLAIALQQQGTRTAGPEGAALLAKAVESYRAALRVYTEADHPVDWAMTMQNLAVALRNQGTRTAGPEGAALLAEAVESYRAALRVYTEVDHPVYWAGTMQNLAGALQQQGTRTAGPEGAALLAEAVDSYRTALSVRTEAEHPVDWAMTMQNLAVALQEQGTRTAGPEGATLLAEAVESYHAALRVRTEADHPVRWATTQENMAIAEQSRAQHDSTSDPRPHLEAALAHVENALRIFDPEHMSYNHNKASALRDQLQAALTALPSSSS